MARRKKSITTTAVVEDPVSSTTYSTEQQPLHDDTYPQSPSDIFRVGMDVTTAINDKCACYIVKEIIDQNTVKVARYHICGQLDHPSGWSALKHGHQLWKYFERYRDYVAFYSSYLAKHPIPLPEHPCEYWTFDNSTENWMRKVCLTQDNVLINGAKDIHTDWTLSVAQKAAILAGESVTIISELPPFVCNARDFKSNWDR